MSAASPAVRHGETPRLRQSYASEHSRAHSHYDHDTTLSTFLTTLYSTASASLVPNSARSPRPRFAIPKLPSANTISFVALCALWYLSSALSSNTGKSILTQFRYPVTLTFVQFAFVSAYSLLSLAAREKLLHSGTAKRNPFAGHSYGIGGQGWAALGLRKPTKLMLHGTFVMSLFQIAGHVFSSMAIARVPVSTVHTIKALSPLFTVISYALLFRVRYGTKTYMSLLPLTLGVMLACSFDLRANAVGFLCALGSTVIFVSQNIYSKKLLPKENSGAGSGGSLGGAAALGGGSGASAKLDKLNLLFYSSGMAFVLMIPIWLYSDSSSLLSLFLSPLPSPSHSSASVAALQQAAQPSLILSFFLNGTVHFCQNLLAFSILAKTSPVTYSIASLVKRIAVICLAIIWSGQIVTKVQGCGMAMTFLGLWLYNRAKGEVEKGERKRGAVEMRKEGFLPSSIEDVALLKESISREGSPNPGSYYSNGGGMNGSAGLGGLGISTPYENRNGIVSNGLHHPVSPPPPPPPPLQSSHHHSIPAPSTLLSPTSTTPMSNGHGFDKAVRRPSVSYSAYPPPPPLQAPPPPGTNSIAPPPPHQHQP